MKSVPKEGFSGVFSWIHPPPLPHSLFLCLLTLTLPAQNCYFVDHKTFSNNYYLIAFINNNIT